MPSPMRCGISHYHVVSLGAWRPPFVRGRRSFIPVMDMMHGLHAVSMRVGAEAGDRWTYSLSVCVLGEGLRSS